VSLIRIQKRGEEKRKKEEKYSLHIQVCTPNMNFCLFYAFSVSKTTASLPVSAFSVFCSSQYLGLRRELVNMLPSAMAGQAFILQYPLLRDGADTVLVPTC